VAAKLNCPSVWNPALALEIRMHAPTHPERSSYFWTNFPMWRHFRWIRLPTTTAPPRGVCSNMRAHRNFPFTPHQYHSRRVSVIYAPPPPLTTTRWLLCSSRPTVPGSRSRCSWRHRRRQMPGFEDPLTILSTSPRDSDPRPIHAYQRNTLHWRHFGLGACQRVCTAASPQNEIGDHVKGSES